MRDGLAVLQLSGSLQDHHPVLHLLQVIYILEHLLLLVHLADLAHRVGLLDGHGLLDSRCSHEEAALCVLEDLLVELVRTQLPDLLLRQVLVGLTAALDLLADHLIAAVGCRFRLVKVGIPCDLLLLHHV